MTLNDILVSSLAQLDRGHDAQTIDIWRDKLTRFANDAIRDLAETLMPVRTDVVALGGDKLLNVTMLSRNCVKLVGIKAGGKPVPFKTSGSSGHISVEADGEIEVSYRYLPGNISSPTDVPELPEHLHGLIVNYVVGRERLSGDTSTQRGGNVYMQLYEMGKRNILPHMGTPDSYSIINRW